MFRYHQTVRVRRSADLEFRWPSSLPLPEAKRSQGLSLSDASFWPPTSTALSNEHPGHTLETLLPSRRYRIQCLKYRAPQIKGFPTFKPKNNNPGIHLVGH